MTLKQKLFLYSLLVITGFSIWSFSLPAQATQPTQVWGAVAASLVDMLKSIVEVIYTGIMPFMLKILNDLLLQPDWFLKFSGPLPGGVLPGFGSASDLITRIWGFCMTAANAIFIIVLVYSTINIIIGTNANVYNIKKVLTTLIPAVLFANLSLVIVVAFVGIGGLLTQGFAALFGTSLDKTLEFINTLCTFNIGGGSGTSAWWWGLLLGGGAGLVTIIGFLHRVFSESHTLGASVTSFVMLIILFWIFLKITLVLLERMFWLFMLTVSAPLAFAADLLPLSFTQKLSSKWTENVFKWIIIFPMIQIAIMAAIYIWTNNKLSADTIVNLIYDSTKFAELSSEQWGSLLIGLTILYFAGKIPEYVKPGGAMPLSGLVATPMAAYKTAQKYAYQPIAGTLAGKTMLGKAAYAIGGGAGRQIRAGSWEKVLPGIQKRALGYEAWRQRQTAGPLGMIFNPKGRAKKMEVDTRLAQAPITSALDIQATNRALEPLNAAAGARFGKDKDTGKNKVWQDLSAEQKRELTTKDRGLKEKERTYTNAFNTMMWRAREGIKEQDISEFDPVPLLKQEVEKGKKDGATPEDRGKGLLAAARLVKIASNKNHPERPAATEALTDLKSTLRDTYGINTAKLLRKGPEKKPKELNIKLLVESAAGLGRDSSLNSLSSNSIAKLSRLLDNGELDIPELKGLLDSGDQAAVDEFLDDSDLDLSDDEQDALKAAVGPEGFSEGEIIARFNALPKARKDAGGDDASPEEVQIKLAAFIETLKEKGTPAAATAAPAQPVADLGQALDNLIRERTLAAGSAETNVETQRRVIARTITELTEQLQQLRRPALQGEEATQDQQITQLIDKLRGELGDAARINPTKPKREEADRVLSEALHNLRNRPPQRPARL